ncbi:GNAT family N-acetyltransferase [Candidatus Dojkabacteria bacterium]|nr:GNAT family N-acetyltransferase [Candidatus Dojkabacteria bacterium]
MSLTFKIYNDLEECKNIWDQIATIKTVNDCWDYRVCFYDIKCPLYFIAAFENNNLVGLLPLQFNEVENYLQFFGGRFISSNRIYTKDNNAEIKRELVLETEKQTKMNLYLNYMTYEDEYTNSYQFKDNLYVLDISNFQTLNDYIDKTFKKKSRSVFRRKLKKFESISHTLEFNRFEDIDRMMEFNIQNFGDDSYFNEDIIKQGVKRLLKSGIKIITISVLIDNIPQSITYSAEFENYFYYLNSGTNKNSVSDLGNYSVLKTLEYAITNKFEFFDAGSNDCNWKERWHFKAIPEGIYKNY